jgi:hypothetical protein
MFEELFEGPIARARQRESPLPDERRPSVGLDSCSQSTGKPVFPFGI